MLENEPLVQQAQVNTVWQFSESPDFDDAVVDAGADKQGSHNKIADYFYVDAPGRPILMVSLARAFHVLTAGVDVDR